MTYNDYLQAVADTCAANSTWRPGQAHFNVLAELAPDVAEPIRGTELDPFHRDDVLPEFLRYVQEQFAATTNREAPSSHLP